MNYLKDKRLYLSGGIQYSTNLNWRTPVIKQLAEEFGINVFDPFSDPKQQKASLLKQAQGNRDFDEMTRIARAFVRKDLSWIDRADLVCAQVGTTKTCGTYHEIFNSNNAKKPTLLVSEDGDKVTIPLWLYGVIPHTAMFNNWEELYSHLREVNAGKHMENNRWWFIYGMV
jgi:nucleoside 2-deoxyribosyltransferase